MIHEPWLLLRRWEDWLQTLICMLKQSKMLINWVSGSYPTFSFLLTKKRLRNRVKGPFWKELFKKKEKHFIHGKLTDGFCQVCAALYPLYTRLRSMNQTMQSLRMIVFCRKCNWSGLPWAEWEVNMYMNSRHSDFEDSLGANTRWLEKKREDGRIRSVWELHGILGAEC